MARPLSAVASFAFAVAAAITPAALAAPGTAGCDTGSWIGGSTEYCNGVFVYHDYVYDDYGATIGDPQADSTGTLSPTDGRARYTADTNSADLVALRLSATGGQLHVSFELNTLRDRELDRRRARDRHRRRRADRGHARVGHMAGPVRRRAAARQRNLRPFRSAPPGGKRSICSRPVIR